MVMSVGTARLMMMMMMMMECRGTREMKTIIILPHAEAVLPPTQGTVEYTYNPGDGLVTKVGLEQGSIVACNPFFPSTTSLLY